MRKIKRWIAVFSAVLTISPLSVLQAAAAEKTDADNAMEQLRMEDEGPDLSEGMLISEVWETEEDGTPYVERIYMKESTDAVTRATTTPKQFMKEKYYGTRGKLRVYAYFSWDTSAKKVYVSNITGKIVDGAGMSGIKSESATPSGNGTAKATATYSCEPNFYLGSGTWTVSMSCDYNGTVK